jgi:hypothetical protein
VRIRCVGLSTLRLPPRCFNHWEMSDSQQDWPDLPYEAWKDTLATLHMCTQVVGKVRLALTPAEPEWAHVALYVTARGLTTSPIPAPNRTFQIDVDLIDHHVSIATTRGEIRRVVLRERPVADFYAELMSNLAALEIEPRFRPVPDEVVERIPFAEDTTHIAYEPDWANRFFRVLSRVDLVMKVHRSRFRGKTSPVHLFWGSFDLANTRFSGRPAAPPPGPGPIYRRSEVGEQICAGFWPGSPTFPHAAFFSYTYPKPEGIEQTPIEPADAGWNPEIGEFALLYDDARANASPEEAILRFFESTYSAGARLQGWNQNLLV